MIVRNEEANLDDCLQPVAHLFDEIVIVDTGSLDATKEIARRYTPHVYDFAWCDDFSAARNESLRHATGDWIFWLDADDRIRPEHAARLERLLATGLDQRQRTLLFDTVLLQPGSEHDLQYVTHPRLFRRHPELRWRGRVHEQLCPEPATLGYQAEFADVQIEHLGYADRSTAERKSRRKLRLLRMDYAVNPDDPSTLLHLGLALTASGNRQEARRCLLRLVEIAGHAQPYMRRVYRALIELSQRAGKPAEAAEIATRALEQFPGDVHLLLDLANAHYSLCDFGASAHVLEAILQLPPVRRHMSGECGDVQTRIAPRMLGAVRRMQGDFSQAEADLQRALQHCPNDLGAWYNLGLVYLDQANGPRLAPVVRQLQAMPAGNIEAGTLAALWQMRHGRAAEAGAIIDELIAVAPHLPRPRMLRAEWLSRNRAPWDEQLRALRDVLRIQPGNLETRHWIRLVEEAQASSASAPPLAVSSPLPAVAVANVT